jgi:uncharacterized delta-60 repeat protein
MSFILLGILNSQASGGITYWLSAVGDSQSDTPSAVALDSQNNAYQIGSSNLGPSTTNFALKKYDPNGTIQWERVLGQAGRDGGTGVAIDSADNIYVSGLSKTGYFGVWHMLLAKYNSAGTLQWQRRLFGASDDQALAVAIDSSDNVYVSGVTESAGAGSTDSILAKYNSSGTLQWQRILGATSFDRFESIAFDSSGNVYVGGSTYAGAGGQDFLLAKYNSSGTLQWQRTFGGASNDAGYGVAVDSSDNVYISGWTYSAGAGNQDFLFAKYNSSGTLQWQKVLGGTGNDEGYDVAIDSSDNVYILGHHAYFNAYWFGMLVAKYDSSGTLQWQRRLSNNNENYSTYAAGIAIDSNDNLYLSASAQMSQTEFFLAKLPNDGSLTGTAYVLNGFTFSYQAHGNTSATSSLTSAASSLTAATSSLTSETSAATAQTVTQTQYLLEI